MENLYDLFINEKNKTVRYHLGKALMVKIENIITGVDTLTSEEIETIQNGRRIAAIKLYKDRIGCDCNIAIQTVDKYIRDNPHTFNK